MKAPSFMVKKLPQSWGFGWERKPSSTPILRLFLKNEGCPKNLNIFGLGSVRKGLKKSEFRKSKIAWKNTYFSPIFTQNPAYFYRPVRKIVLEGPNGWKTDEGRDHQDHRLPVLGLAPWARKGLFITFRGKILWILLLFRGISITFGGKVFTSLAKKSMILM